MQDPTQLLQMAMNYGLAVVLTVWLTKYILDGISKELREIAEKLERVEQDLAVILDYVKLEISEKCAGQPKTQSRD